ncbi:MAG: GNAT family N-acetyltransferase [Wenzhouxiangellaceae bacterium]|nr:GNAT family N-acetyltransferase [Wenzhouxiangellaceae bacterium]
MGDEIVALCHDAFPDFDACYLLDRLPHIADPVLVEARRANELVGFKMGYRRGKSLFYSWLGAVQPDCRRQGIASRLMAAQHDWAHGLGFERIETRTRTSNTPMIILNLQFGFVITGFETDSAGRGVVTQRKQL